MVDIGTLWIFRIVYHGQLASDRPCFLCHFFHTPGAACQPCVKNVISHSNAAFCARIPPEEGSRFGNGCHAFIAETGSTAFAVCLKLCHRGNGRAAALLRLVVVADYSAFCPGTAAPPEIFLVSEKRNREQGSENACAADGKAGNEVRGEHHGHSP